ncbi:hypothetical protein [Dactylosporangium sp. CA-233914]|uniref:hypothetical protein n=1 Tax=Dactylosporangium sp. CA-233914 TaxID=3239934 RepID=UPI003D926BA4
MAEDFVGEFGGVVLLVGGDKSGNWRRWYHTAIPIAGSAYSEHLRRLQEKDGER